jgi:hypothetical protein
MAVVRLHLRAHFRKRTHQTSVAVVDRAPDVGYAERGERASNGVRRAGRRMGGVACSQIQQGAWRLRRSD